MCRDSGGAGGGGARRAPRRALLRDPIRRTPFGHVLGMALTDALKTRGEDPSLHPLPFITFSMPFMMFFFLFLLVFASHIVALH